MGEASGAPSRALVERTANWLMAQALKDADLKDIVRGCCERLHDAGVAIARVQFSFSMLHPLYRGIGYTWQRGQGLQVDAFRHRTDGIQPERFLNSPYYHLMRHGLDHLRRRLDTGGAAEFPIFDDLRKEGLTDYLAFVSSFEMEKGQGMVGSWTTDQRGGSTDGEIEAPLRIPPFPGSNRGAQPFKILKNRNYLAALLDPLSSFRNSFCASFQRFKRVMSRKRIFAICPRMSMRFYTISFSG
jgi:adenylate cyclase